MVGNSAAIPPASAEEVGILFSFQLFLIILRCACSCIVRQTRSLSDYKIIRRRGCFIKDMSRSFGYSREKKEKKGERLKSCVHHNVNVNTELTKMWNLKLL